MTPVFKFTLENATLGTKVIAEPIGWKDCKMTLERHPIYHSLIEHFEGDFIFYGDNGDKDGGYDYLRECMDEEGPRTEVFITIDISFDGGFEFEELFFGRVDLSLKEDIRGVGKGARTLKAPIIRGDFWTKFLNNQDKTVDIRGDKDLEGHDVDPAVPIDIVLKSQEVIYVTEYDGHSGSVDTVDPVVVMTTTNITLSGLPGPIDGETMVDGMRVLVGNAQTTAANRGIYIITASGAWPRATDANTAAELTGATVTVLKGTQAGSYKQRTTIVTVGTTSQNWTAYDYVEDEIFWTTEDGSDIANPEVVIYFTPTTEVITKEIEDSFELPVFAETSSADLSEVLEIITGYGEVVIEWDMEVDLSVSTAWSGAGVPEHRDIKVELFVQINENTPVLIDSDSNSYDLPYGGDYWEPMPLEGSTTITVAQSDRVKFFCRYESHTAFSAGGDYTWREVRGGLTRSNVKFTFNSNFQDSVVDGFFIHDSAGAILDRILGEPDLLYSPYLGSESTNYRQYDDPGQEWRYVNIRGHQVREKSLADFPYFESWNHWWKGADNILCLGAGPITIEGEKYLEIAPRSDFYQDEISATFAPTTVPVTYDLKKFYKQIQIGYEKWQSAEVGSLDDPQTKREYAGNFPMMGEPITLYSSWIAASLAFEVTRRKRVQDSADWKFDEDVFVLSIRDDAGRWVPEPGTAFNATNLNAANKRYNLRITPAFNMRRFLDYLSGCLREYPGEAFTFASGEGNFKMTTNLSDGSPYDGALAENQDMPASDTNYIFPQVWKFSMYASWQQYTSVRNFPKLAVRATLDGETFTPLVPQKITLNPVSGALTFAGWER